MDAEQGLAGGAAINVQTKSGTNVLRGSGFEYFTNEHLKAWPMRFDDAALNTGDKPEASYHQFGGTVGGPIKQSKAFYFVSYESTRDHRAVDNTVTVPLPAMLTGRPVVVADAYLRSALGKRGRLGSDAVPGAAGRSELRALRHSDQSELPEHHPRRADWTRSPRRSRSYIPANNIGRERDNYFVSAPFEFDRQQVDSKVDYNVNPNFNLAGTFGVLHYRTSVPTVFGDEAVGRADRRQQQSRTRSRQHVPAHRHGHVYLYADVPDGRALRLGPAGDGLGAARPRHEYRERRAGHPRNQRHRATSRAAGPRSTSRRRRLRDGRGERELHAVLPARPPVAVRGEFQLAQEQAQRPVRRRHLSHGAQPCPGGVHHRGLRRAGRVRLRSRHHGALRGRRSGDGQLRGDVEGSRYNTVAAFLLGQASRAGRTLQVPDEYKVRARLYSLYIRDRWTVGDNLTVDVGTRWEYFPIPTRPDRGIERYDVDDEQSAALRSRRRARRTAASIRARRCSPRAWARRIGSARNGSPAPATG